MEIIIKEELNKDKKTVMEFINMKMEINIKDSGKMIKSKVKGDIFMLMAISIKVNLLLDLNKV